MNNYTIIIPSHDRHHYLERSIKYFSGFNANIIYVDSSVKSHISILPKNVSYFHCPSMTFPEKALFAIKQCNTEYIAFCADDDFLIEGALNIGINNLQENEDLTSAVGRYLGFNDDFSGAFFKIQNHNEWPDVTNNCEQNIVSFLSNYHQILWALYKRSTIETAYGILCAGKFSNDNFIELVIATICAGTGGISFIDEIWGVREINKTDHWGQRHKPLHTITNTNTLTKDVRHFVNILEPIVGRGNAELAINSYITSSKYKNKYPFVKKFSPDILLTLIRRIKTKRLEKVDDLCLKPIIEALQ